MYGTIRVETAAKQGRRAASLGVMAYLYEAQGFYYDMQPPQQ